jgi:hypothetical protein
MSGSDFPHPPHNAIQCSLTVIVDRMPRGETLREALSFTLKLGCWKA